jgi:GNAT superfamily N-acetyltransferase
VFEHWATRRANRLRAARWSLTVANVAELVIRPVDPHDDADMDGFQRVYAAAERAEDPDVGLYSRRDAVAMLTSQDETSLFDGYGGFVDGQMVGETILIGSKRDNLAVAQLLIWVHPVHQRHGYGARMLAHAEDHASSLGRTVLRVQARVGGALDRNRRFADRHGYTLAMTEIERRLPLPVDPALLDRLEAAAATYHGQYEIRTVVGRVPPDLRASYVELNNLLQTEMPHGDLELEAARDTVENLETFEQEREDAGRTRVSAFAVRDGVVAAFTDSSVAGGASAHVDQYGTLVHPDHRGHRLGMAVKCAQLRVLSEAFPDRTHVQTSNAETNTNMVAINEALGFAVHQVWGEFEKRLA